MKHNILNKVITGCVATAFIAMSMSSCGDNEPDNPDVPGEPGETGNVKTTVLLYAVASNNLYGNLVEDKEEMVAAARQMNLEGLRMLVYQVTPYDVPALLELQKLNDGSLAFVTVKEYDRELYSTDPERISSVIDDVRSAYESELYGLVLWSHGTGLDPFSSTRSLAEDSHPMMHSFGSDKNPDKNPTYYDQINIDELADAIPDNVFDFIWFDACYMSGIETIYELRDKCNRFVGYPTEVFTPGMPYDLTLPYILAENPDLEGGAKAFFDYYAGHPSPGYRAATVCVADMDKLEAVADYCKAAYAGTAAPVTSGLLRYTRGSVGPFFDFGQYTGRMAALNGNAPSFEEFDNKLGEMVIFSAATERDFNYNEINPENFSGISCHVFVDDGSRKSEFYKTLDWYKRVYQ